LVDYISLPRDVFGNVNILEIWSCAFVISTEQEICFEPADEVCEVVYLTMYVTGHKSERGSIFIPPFFNFGARWGGRATPPPGRITREKEIRSP